MTEAEALRLLQAGAKGIVRKTADVESILSCLRTVASGRSWMEDCVFRDSARQERYPRSELTPREHQVLEMVEQGFKNKEIALELGIRPGNRQDSPEAHLREDRRAGPVWPGHQRAEGARIGFDGELNVKARCCCLCAKRCKSLPQIGDCSHGSYRLTVIGPRTPGTSICMAAFRTRSATLIAPSIEVPGSIFTTVSRS